ncbi:MAG: iron export ABC transporter permease subunit FetB [Planctomycetales bacterium]|nr:iron export ABC transporter permease subunit FetB [Planctomycetales bacterium]
MEYVQLTNVQVALVAALIAINGAISVALKLQLEKTLLIASLRTIVQLSIVGMCLQWVFTAAQWYVVLLLMSVMTMTAGYTAVQQTKRRHVGVWVDTLISVWASSWLVTGLVLIIVLERATEWYRPQYVIPLLGMVLGNTLNGISLGLNSLGETVISRRDHIEGLLALGATRWEAARDSVQQAVRTGMIPIVNSMMIVGIVSLPGMMTGQLLAGADPTDAVKYQIVVMFLIASATALGTILVVLLAYRRLFNAQHQFRYDLLKSDK